MRKFFLRLLLWVVSMTIVVISVGPRYLWVMLLGVLLGMLLASMTVEDARTRRAVEAARDDLARRDSTTP